MCVEFRKIRARFLSNVGFLTLIAVGASACSNGLARFDETALTAGIAGTGQPNIHSQVIQNAQAVNPYPGSIDPAYTSSVVAGGQPLNTALQTAATLSPNSNVLAGAVRPTKPVGFFGRLAQTVRGPSTIANNLGQAQQQQFPVQFQPQIAPQTAIVSQPLQVANASRPVYQIDPTATGSINSQITQQSLQALPAEKVTTRIGAHPAGTAGGTTELTRQPVQITPAQTALKTTSRLLPTVETRSHTSGNVPVQTSVLPVQSTRVQSTRVQSQLPSHTPSYKGWTSVGGTAITTRSGETVYNLSRRYGVPADAILAVNGIQSSDQLNAGQKIIIPTYQFSRHAGVSAPDANANVIASSSSIGFSKKLPESVSVPRSAPENYQPKIDLINTGSVNTYSTTTAQNSLTVAQPLPAPIRPKPYVRPDATAASVPAEQVSGGAYKVVSGDTVSGIASRNGISSNALMSANNMQNANIRVGQILTIPGIANPKSAGIGVGSNQSNSTQLNATAGTLKSGGEDAAHRIGSNTRNIDPIVTGSQTALSPAATGIEQLRWPVRGRIVHGFGEMVNGKRNDGINISVPSGTLVKAAENGVVLYAGNELAGFGNLVLLKHSDGLVTAYGYNSSLAVKRGQKVSRGQTIARAGHSGDAEAPMLHFEVRKNSTPVNPTQFLGS